MAFDRDEFWKRICLANSTLSAEGSNIYMNYSVYKHMHIVPWFYLVSGISFSFY